MIEVPNSTASELSDLSAFGYYDRTVRVWCNLVALWVLAGCGALAPAPETGEPTATPSPSGTSPTPTPTLTATPSPTATPPTLSTLQLQIFNSSCALADCHGSPLGAPMSLQPGETYANVVNVPADQLGTMFRVKPGDPGNSYFVHKIAGTAAAAGGTDDTRMPLDLAPLSADDLARIEAWIAAGAQND